MALRSNLVSCCCVSSERRGEGEGAGELEVGDAGVARRQAVSSIYRRRRSSFPWSTQALLRFISVSSSLAGCLLRPSSSSSSSSLARP